MTIDSESFLYRLQYELPRHLFVYDLCPLLLSELAIGFTHLELHECEHWRRSTTPKQRSLGTDLAMRNGVMGNFVRV